MGIALAVVAGLGSCWAYVEYRSFFRVPEGRLGPDEYYSEMPPDDRHHYLTLPIDYTAPEKGQYREFYILSPVFKEGGPVVIFLTDGQMEVVSTRPDLSFFDSILGGVSYVLIGVRGHAPTLFPEIYRDDGSLNVETAMRLYGSDQQVEDIEAVRRDLEKRGYLPPDGRVELFGASGAGVLAQQYLSKYGQHVSRAILQVTGAPDLASSKGWSFSPSFADFNPKGAALLGARIREDGGNDAGLSYLLFQLGRSRLEPKKAQLDLLHGSAWTYLTYWLRPQYNLPLAKLMMSAPSGAAAKVRMYELLGHDIAHYASEKRDRPNLMYEFGAEVLAEFADAPPKTFSIERSSFSGEVLVIAGTLDVVFSARIGKALAAAYPNAKLALFEDGHRMLRARDYYRKLRTAFLLGGFESGSFQRWFHDPRRINRQPKPDSRLPERD